MNVSNSQHRFDLMVYKLSMGDHPWPQPTGQRAFYVMLAKGRIIRRTVYEIYVMFCDFSVFF